uniref:Zinc finger PHD-type domain-containing protein n=3 Tax=Davidia involucrata TaxID=16924 RepID=A0A5B6ZPX5_DAVIN
MRSRTHRLPTSEPPDDWVDGSWTVDCVCGVNFDDGEEMVNCDECGVWVHTRCSRYVKSEKLFACDKCKSKNSRNDSEETEVAQLLVELPTKTLRMDNPYPSNCPPPRRPFRLWTDIPMEERVHVQGIPGGDPALFEGLSSIFTPELWKCTGYVPKKFSFQYTEFPCWDEKQEVDAKIKEEIENPVDNGAGVLFSLSKENVSATPVVTSVGGMKRQVEGGRESLVTLKDMNKWEGEDLDFRHPQNGVKKERSLLRPFVIHSGKHKKEMAKDPSGKKKATVVDKEGDSNKRAALASKTAFTPSSDSKQLEFYEDRGPNVLETDTPSIKNGNLRDTLPEDPLPDGYHVVDNDVDEPKNKLASSEHPSEALSSDMSRHNFSIGASPKEDKAGHQVSASIESSPKTDNGMVSLLEHNDFGSVSVKEEVVGVALDNVNDNGGGSSRSAGIDSRTEPLVEDLATAAPEVKDNQNFQDSNGDMSPNSLQSNVKFKTEVDIDNSGGVLDVEPSLDDVKLDGDNLSENVKVNSVAITSSQSSDHKVQYVDKSTDAVSDCQIVKPDELPGDPCQLKQQLEGSVGSMAGRKSSSELKHGPRPAEEPSKSGGLILSPLAPLSQRKMIVSVGKSSSTSLTTVISRPSISDNQRPANTQHHNASTKQRGMSEGNVSIKKDNASTDVVRDEDGCEMPKKIPKEHLKSSVSSLLKTSHSTKISHASVSKRTLSDSKDPGLCSSSKASSVQNIVVTSGSGESASLLPTQSALHVQNKMTASGLPHRGEKVNLLNSQASSKVNNTPSMHPPAPSNSAAVLSDEELALLLHQELNSSPRVPRVPRMRHAGSLPQLASPTATSMLMKRTSSSGGKDHGLVSRRKNKDLAKDGSRSSREIDDDAKKMDRVPSSPDQRRHDSVCTTDPFTKREADNRSGKGVHSVKKCIPSASIATVSSGLSSSTEVNEQNLSSTRNSPRNASDDETGTIGGPIHRTLPGLIAEIMSKGNRMTYEELCNAVLPHWPNLRKHNGERYAYSSHSQAVLDCLRNRHEWARLVDRGPKTNASRKRRKLDAEPTSFESEDNEYGKDRAVKEVESKSFESHQEEFPKGKRKARKRRRLALQGRGIKDVRRRRKAEVLSDDDIGSFSSSSEESMFSEDEIQGGGTCPVGSEASASSDET